MEARPGYIDSEQSLCSVLATRGLSTDLARGVSSCNLHIVALGVCRSAMTDVVLYVPARGLVACLLSSLREEGPLSGCVCGVSLDVVVSRDWELSCSARAHMPSRASYSSPHT